jgi:hypothetical protein
MEHRLENKNEYLLTGIVREQYFMEWLFLSILWVVSAVCAYILCVNLLLLPRLGPPYTPTPEVTLWQWFSMALLHPFVWPAALATAVALGLVIGLSVYFSVWLPSEVDSTIHGELARIGPTNKRPWRLQYVTRIDSKGTLTARLLPKTAESGEYGLVVLRATLSRVSAKKLRSTAQRYFLASDRVSLATVCSLEELHWKVTQLARAIGEL